MTQSVLLLVCIVIFLACLPFVVRRLQQYLLRGQTKNVAGMRIVDTLPIGPGQRVVSVEMGGQGQRVTLVLGVTAASITCLHAMSESGPPNGATPPGGDFGQQLQSLQDAP